jgi:hypothetical protein
MVSATRVDRSILFLPRRAADRASMILAVGRGPGTSAAHDVLLHLRTWFRSLHRRLPATCRGSLSWLPRSIRPLVNVETSGSAPALQRQVCPGANAAPPVSSSAWGRFGPGLVTRPDDTHGARTHPQRGRPDPALTRYSSDVATLGATEGGFGYFRMLTALAMTSPTTTRHAVAWTAIASFAHRAMGMTSVGLKAVASVKPRYR